MLRSKKKILSYSVSYILLDILASFLFDVYHHPNITKPKIANITEGVN